MTTEHREMPVRAGVFEQVEHAQDAVAKLRTNGFTNQEISVICSDAEKLSGFSKSISRPTEKTVDDGNAMLAGGAAGIALGSIAALAVASGPAGVLMAAGAIGGFLEAGTFAGAMVNRGFDPEAVEFYEQALGQGELLVTVQVEGDDVPQRLALAERLLAEAGAKPLSLEQ